MPHYNLMENINIKSSAIEPFERSYQNFATCVLNILRGSGFDDVIYKLSIPCLGEIFKSLMRHLLHSKAASNS